MKKARQQGYAWLALVMAFGLHVADEATHDFLSVYNPNVLAIRERIPWLPLPTFEFEAWLSMLVLAIVALAALSGQAFEGKRFMRPLALVFGSVMLLNGLAHFASSIWMRTWMPGVYSSPFLLAASVWLLGTHWKRGRGFEKIE